MSICTDQTCAGAPGCRIDYVTNDARVTRSADGFDVAGRMTDLSGRVTAMIGALQCEFEIGLAAPEPFEVHYALDRTDCSESVKVEARPEVQGSGITVEGSSAACDEIVALVRSQIGPDTIEGFRQGPLESLTCAACAGDCPDTIACR